MLNFPDLAELRPIRELIHEQLRNAILSGSIQDGERLIEADLAERMKVSRTPIREAIRMLEADGLVVSLPRRGVMVQKFAIEDIVEIYKIRQALEVMAIRTAAERIEEEELALARRHWELSDVHLAARDYSSFYNDNENFTNLLIQSSRMPRTIQLIATYRDQLLRFRKITLSSPERQIAVIQEHGAILEAVEGRDVDGAGHLVFEHLENALRVCSVLCLTQNGERVREKKGGESKNKRCVDLFVWPQFR